MTPPPPKKKWLLFCDYTTNLSFLKFNAKPRNSHLVYLIVFIFLDLVIIIIILTSIQQIGSLEENARTVHVENHSQRGSGPIFSPEISF